MKTTRRRKPATSTTNSAPFFSETTRPLTRAIITSLVSKGLSPQKTARIHSCTTRHVYWVASRYELPLNPPIVPNSPQEGRILRSLLINRLNYALVAKIHSQSEHNIREVAARYPLLRNSAQKRA